MTTSAAILSQTSQAGTRTVRSRDPRAFGDVVSSSFSPLRLDCDRPEAFAGRIRSRQQGDVFLAEVRANAHTIAQRPTEQSRRDPKIKVGVTTSGTMIVRQSNREATILPGDMFVLSTEDPYDLVTDDEFHALFVTFPKAVADFNGSDLEQLTATRVQGDDGLAAVVRPMLATLPANFDALASSVGTRFVNHTIDLLIDTLHERLGSLRPNLPNRRRAALVSELYAYIDEHLRDPDLDPASIAAANFISTRLLHGIFQQEGVSVSEWIRTRRLEMCRRELLDPMCRHRSVADIAFSWGFVHPSHFSRLFRKTYDVTPSECRPPAI